MSCREVRQQAERILLAGYFGTVYIMQWVRKRASGDRSPVVVFVPVRSSGGARRW
jgi:hypothetical protein